ncbi:uncharacterized protein L3040_001519 [Drepanopeziza brunnea f. sp. 'multigermtubi']|uniref:uncharacterized protein n=1 Tax=Drepanopeziza brunnea f. sp. 'multigermtubi' TaxID=698441 RepID=UPI00238B7ABF|nr:hypothetical protein L3040_001519 [Drepanopeziza brunnea f. sp. 'multigermtubi']
MPRAFPARINLPFLIHIALETPAALSFFLRPDNQLSSPAPQAHALIRQYAALLLSSNLVAAVFTCREVDGTSRWVAAALAVYHLAPLLRALARISGSGCLRGQRGTARTVRETGARRGENAGNETGLGGPWVHALAHAGALGALLWEFGFGGQ